MKGSNPIADSTNLEREPYPEAPMTGTYLKLHVFDVTARANDSGNLSMAESHPVTAMTHDLLIAESR